MSVSPLEDPAAHDPSSDDRRRFTLEELESAVLSAESSVCFVAPRILRRVIKQDRRLTGFGLKVPHRKCHVIDRGPLLEIVDLAELGRGEIAELPEQVLLLARPTPRKLATTPVERLLNDYWRLLFHVRVHAELENRVRAGILSEGAVLRRIQQIGTSEFEEIRMVLGQENMLLPPRDDLTVYIEFVAVYLELRFFAGSFLPRFFPSLQNLSVVDVLVAGEIDAERIFQASRPRGASDPRDYCPLADLIDLPAEVELDSAEPEPLIVRPSETKFRRFMRKSQRPASLGNVVRAAIYHARAECCVPPEFAERVRTAIKMDVYRLIRRLQNALELDDASPQPWHESLYVLVRQTTRGVWTAEAKLLYDLQKACIDHEREIYTIDLAEWAISWGRRPLKRLLPNQREVLMLKHLRSAARRLGSIRISAQQRTQLARLIHDAKQRVEAKLRKQLRPQITAVLDQVGLVAWNIPERVARGKLVEELLDHIEEHGYLTMGDLRDAISRNKLKLPDLSEPGEFLRGDQLLRADRELAAKLDGVYRGGEFYLRWMQRISSLAFGTDVGRLLTRFAIVPFGGAYVALAGLHHVWEMIAGSSRTAGDAPPLEAASAGFQPVREHLMFSLSVFVLGVFILCVINSPAFRGAIAELWKRSCRGIKTLVVEPIRQFILSPWVQRMIHSRLFSLAIRFGVKPLVWTWISWMFLPKETWQATASTTLLLFVAFTVVLNSRWGRTAEEVVADWIVQSWHRFGVRLIAGLFWWIVDVFKWWLETVERLMYSVDEWLRFKSGEGIVAQTSKAVLGLFWFFIAYVVRFCVNVLLEPQINPIKHFPVVTVSHKMLLPLIPSLAYVLEITMDKPLAWTVAATTIWSIPGVFGFLVWELKENWRLYAANRSRILSPMPVGAHGETMGRLLKTGFHSGTLPKRYAKLRRAERRARAGGNWRKVRKHLHVIEGIELAVRRFVEREFLEYFVQSKLWQEPAASLREMKTCTNGVRLVLDCTGDDGSRVDIHLSVEAGWLVADLPDAGSIDSLSTPRRQVFATALAGFYKSLGVELDRQQVEKAFASPMPWYRFTPEGFALWPEGTEDVEELYDLREGAWIAPQAIRGLTRRILPTLPRVDLVFTETILSWDDWVIFWNQEV